ncbi:MAG: hypothetical protein ACM3TN_25145 [Alphaproteobacteria bacterium]
MEKISILPIQKQIDGQGNKDPDGPVAEASGLTHTIMNQLTIIYLSCAKLRRRLPPPSSVKEETEIQIIESAVAQVAKQVEALCFRLEKTTRRRARARSVKPRKFRSKTNLSFIPPREREKP